METLPRAIQEYIKCSLGNLGFDSSCLMRKVPNILLVDQRSVVLGRARGVVAVAGGFFFSLDHSLAALQSKPLISTTARVLESISKDAYLYLCLRSLQVLLKRLFCLWPASSDIPGDHQFRAPRRCISFDSFGCSGRRREVILNKTCNRIKNPFICFFLSHVFQEYHLAHYTC